MRRRKQLTDVLKETIGYCILNDETLDHPLWRTGLGIGCGPVVREAAE
jgi:hypothetical protein